MRVLIGNGKKMFIDNFYYLFIKFYKVYKVVVCPSDQITTSISPNYANILKDSIS